MPAFPHFILGGKMSYENYANLVRLITDRCVENIIALPTIFLPVHGMGVDLAYLEELSVKIITAQENNGQNVNWPKTLGFEDCELLSGYIDHAIERSM